MSDKIEYSRLLQKRFSQTGIVPTMPASGVTTLSQMLYTDLLNGEFAINTADKRIWFRSDAEIVELFGVSGGTYANLFIEGDSDTSINSIANSDSGGLNIGEYNFTVGENNSTFADNSAVIAGFNNIINVDSDNSAIIGGNGNIISGATNVVMLGCENVDAFQSGSTYVQNLVITDVPSTGDTNTDKILVRGINGAINAIDVGDLPSGSNQNLLQVLQTGDYAAYGDTAYYLGQDGFLIDGQSGGKSYLVDVNAFYTQLTRSDDFNTTDASSILLDSNGIRLDSNSDIIFGQNVVNNKITYDGQTMDVENDTNYIASATTNSFMPKSYIDNAISGATTFAAAAASSSLPIQISNSTEAALYNEADLEGRTIILRYAGVGSEIIFNYDISKCIIMCETNVKATFNGTVTDCSIKGDGVLTIILNELVSSTHIIAEEITYIEATSSDFMARDIKACGNIETNNVRIKCETLLTEVTNSGPHFNNCDIDVNEYKIGVNTTDPNELLSCKAQIDLLTFDVAQNFVIDGGYIRVMEASSFVQVNIVANSGYLQYVRHTTTNIRLINGTSTHAYIVDYLDADLTLVGTLSQVLTNDCDSRVIRGQLK